MTLPAWDLCEALGAEAVDALTGSRLHLERLTVRLEGYRALWLTQA